ncbi:MAG: T9SS type A sorting domain-containing protein [Bacteroidota bacterium]
MLYSQTAIQAEMGNPCLRFQKLFSFICWSAFSFSLGIAQPAYPISFTLSQTEFSARDTIELEVSMGTFEQQVPAEDSHSIVYTYSEEVFDIDPNSPFSIVAGANSFLLTETQWTWDVTVDEEAHTLQIDLDRTDGQAFPAGYGEAFQLTGIIVTVEEIHVRRAAEEAIEQLVVNIYPNPSHDWIKVESASRITRMRLLDHSGRLAAQWQGHVSNPKLSVSDLSAGVYHLSLINEAGERSTHRILVKH